MDPAPIRDPLYIFVDESGNFDFSPKGSRYFILTAVVTEDPIQGVAEMLGWRHEMLARATDPKIRNPRECTHFHCSEDDQQTRDGVFAIVTTLNVDAYAVIIQKNKSNPSIRAEGIFYERAFKGLVPYVIRRHGGQRDIHIFVSQIELKRKRAAITAGLKTVLNAEPGIGPYRLHFHPNHSHHMLQVSDYVCWAIARKWEQGDDRSLNIVRRQVQAQFDMFARGTTTYY